MASVSEALNPPEDQMRMGSATSNRKRSAKGAKNTKPPAEMEQDGEGCSCSKKMKNDGTKSQCDGSCNQKMDSISTDEYLTACRMGIQDRSIGYIRARIDTSERLDLKCGNGAISEGEKCHVGKATKVKPDYKNYGPSKKTLTGAETGIYSRQRIQREGFVGSPFGGDPFSRKEQAKRTALVTGGSFAASTAYLGYKAGGLKGALAGAAVGAVVGGIAGGIDGASTAQQNRRTSRAARNSLERQKFEKPLATRFKNQRAKMKEAGASGAELREQDYKNAMTLARGYDRIRERNRGRYGDSMYAKGFTPDMDQLKV